MGLEDKDIVDRLLLDRLAGRRLAVIGDSMVDRFLWGSVDRISPEAPVPVVKLKRETVKLGGAANVAANIRALGAEAVLFSLCGRDEAAGQLRSLLDERGIDPAGLVVDVDRPTTIKTRILAHNQQVVRTDLENAGPVKGAVTDQVLERLAASGPFDGIILSDLEYGVRTYHDHLREVLPVVNLEEEPEPGTLAERNAGLLAR